MNVIGLDPRGGTPHGLTTSERFWMKVDRSAGPNGCWLWLASGSPFGHGRFWTMNNGRRVIAQAHRLSWEMQHGPIPDGISVLHRCDQPRCVNPAHLFLGTQADNVADMRAKGRARGGRNPQPGEMNGNARVDADVVRLIRARRANGETVRVISGDVGLSPAQVSRIATGKRWGHLQ